MASRLFITNASVLNAINKLGQDLTDHYRNLVSEESPLFVIVIAHGAIKFYAELCTSLLLPMNLGLACTRGQWDDVYGVRTVEFRDFKLESLSRRHVLVVEDICDSGRTLKILVDTLRYEADAASVKVVTLFRNNMHPDIKFVPDEICFETDGHYVYGFGMDSEEGLDRNLNAIYYKG